MNAYSSSIIAHGSSFSLITKKFTKDFSRSFLKQQLLLSKRTPISCFSLKDEEPQKTYQSFCIVDTDVQLDNGTIFSSMAFYIFSLHVPLSFGGLSAICNIFHQPDLEPQTKALSILGLQVLELTVVLVLLDYSLKPQHILKLFKAKELPEERNWLVASATGFLFLVFLVFLTSVVANQLLGLKGTSDPTLHELLASSPISTAACILVYCVITPLLEEIVYRGYLLTSLSNNMKWQQAVLLSSAVFSASHFSGENFLQLLIIGIVLGCSYCWTGNLKSSFLIHSLYNSLILFLRYMS